MGTSKGYIQPTSIPWSKAKRAVTALRKHPNSDSIIKAVGQYASARRSESGSTSLPKAISGMFGLVGAIKGGSVDTYLRDIDRLDLIGKSIEEIWKELLYSFTNNTSTIEDSLAFDALMDALKNFKISDLEDLKDIPISDFLLEILICFICYDFDLHYSEQISKNKTPSDVSTILNDVHGYISTTLHTEMDLASISTIDYEHISNAPIVVQMMERAFTALKDYYGE